MNNNNNNNNNENNNTMMIGATMGLFMSRIRIYLIIIIFGYFIIKLLCAPFGIYPDKYYNQTMTITTNDENADKETIVNGYVPGMWNSELTDLLIMVVMALILFFMKMDNNFPLTTRYGINYAILIPFCIGLVVAVVKSQIGDDTIFDYIYVSLILVIGLGIIFYNMLLNKKASSKISYLVYVGVLILLVILLFVFKNNSSVFTNILYNIRDKNAESCTRYDMENVIVKSSGDEFKMNIPFITWLVLMVFSYNNNIINNVFNGLLLGVFVGGVSFLGMQYPIIKTASDFCSTYDECVAKDIPTGSLTNSETCADNDKIQELDTQATVLENRINVNSWTVIGISMTMMLVLLYLAIKMN